MCLAEPAQPRCVEDEQQQFGEDVADDGPDGRRPRGVGQTGDAQQQPRASARHHGGERHHEPVHASPADEELPHAGGGETGGVQADRDDEGEVSDEREHRASGSGDLRGAPLLYHLFRLPAMDARRIARPMIPAGRANMIT